jgi:ribosomal protein S18 acetylase RimI-like enzyme
MNIRRIEPSEAKDIIGIQLNELKMGSVSHSTRTIDELKGLLDKLTNICLAAEEGSRIIGYLVSTTNHTVNSIELGSVWVSDDEDPQHIFPPLLSNLIEKARVLQVGRIMATANSAAAIELLSRHGFTPTGTRNSYIISL